jgi:A-factor biosynthesis hotdog domain
MHVLAPTAPRVIPGRTIDILDLAPSAGISRGFTRVDLGDPVFFDHPLDHVPGMLLVVAGLELAEHAAMLQPDNVSFRITFTKFCELDAPVEVSAICEAGGNRIEFIQSGRSIARGLLGRRDTPLPAELAPVPALGDGSISSELVHRADRGNVALGPLTVEGGRVWTRIRAQAAINGLSPRASAVASIVEAARQFGIAILHRWGEHPMGTKMIFVGLTADVPTTVPLGHMTRALSWQATPAEQTRKLHIDVHAVSDRAIKVGSIVVASRCADGVEYAQLRAA